MSVSTMGRRQFLSWTACASGAAALSAALPIRLRGGKTVQVGVLVPSSRLYPHLSANLLAGVQLAVEAAGADVPYVRMYDRDIRTAPGTAVTASRELIGRGGLEAVIAMVNAAGVPALRDLHDEARIPLIVINVGAHMHDRFEGSPYLFQNTLGYWQANHAMGRWAAANVGRRGCLAMSLHESGFDSAQSFAAGFERAGGAVIQSAVTDSPVNPTAPAEFIRRAVREGVDFIFALYGPHDADTFARAYEEAGSPVPLLGGGFFARQSPAGSAVPGMRSCLSWSPALATAENRGFCKAFAGATGRAADAFAVLGYESGQMVAAAAARPENLDRALSRTSFTGPRGTLTMDTATRTTTFPLYLRTAECRGAGRPGASLERFADTRSINEHTLTGPASPRSGWMNTYLCV